MQTSTRRLETLATLLLTVAALGFSSVSGQTGDVTSLDLTPATSAPPSLAGLLPNQDPQTRRLLRDSINRVTELINSYRQDGLANMPNLPSVPGLNSVMALPDKLLRAELSMLQDEIRMAQDMMQNPVYATMNLPKDLAAMMSRILEQMEQ